MSPYRIHGYCVPSSDEAVRYATPDAAAHAAWDVSRVRGGTVYLSDASGRRRGEADRGAFWWLDETGRRVVT